MSWPPHLVECQPVCQTVCCKLSVLSSQCLDLPNAHCVGNSQVSTSNSLSASVLTCASPTSLPRVLPSVENYFGIAIQICHQMCRRASWLAGVPASRPLLHPYHRPFFPQVSLPPRVLFCHPLVLFFKHGPVQYIA